MIPHILHQIWAAPPPPQKDRQREPSALFKEFSVQWRVLNPTWEYHLWDYPRIFSLLRPTDLWKYYIDADQYVARPRIYQFRSDIARLQILKEYGGVYVDFDFEPLKPLETVLSGHTTGDGTRYPAPECFMAWEIQDKRPCNAIIGTAAEHPWIDLLLENLPQSCEAHQMDQPANLTGPHFFARMWKRYGAGFSDVVIYPEKMFYPYGPRQFKGGETYPDAIAVHHWANGRRIHRRPLEKERHAKSYLAHGEVEES